jgi:8-oxo-dGTP diphosphatase
MGTTDRPLEPAVGAAVIAADSRVLLVRRAKPPLAGEWSLVGGHLEPGESPEAAVVREVREECALEVRIMADLGVVPVEREGYGYAIREYACVPLRRGDVPRAGDDAADVRWASFEELASLGLREEAVEVVRRALLALAEGSGTAPPEGR